MSNPNYRLLQQALTELNADGNDERGRDGEDLRVTSDGYINTAPSGELPKWKKVTAPGHHAGVTEEEWAEVVKALHEK
jgi:hypothetical protein|tara:strand:+ start:3844 stop:4077 length:234 start_codon:yes stop_codon:yes gene_type:complete